MTALPFIRRPRQLPVGLILPAALLIIWEVTARAGLLNPILSPAPSLVFTRLFTMLAAGELRVDIGASLARLAIGALAGSLIAIPLGLLIGSSRLARHLLGPSFNVLKQIALFAWIPLISVWFGTGEVAKVVFVSMAVFTPVVINTWEGTAEVPEHLREVARIYALGPAARLRRLILPAALPQIFTGLRLGLIYGWLATVGAEYFMTVAPGIGSQMTAGRELLEMDLVMVGVLLLGGIGFAINSIAEASERRLVSWKNHH
ncbi:ABC transporter permease [Gemmobacter sp. 24YEA27]|uniref:ABC transporter permease n=1 Tax=Gemmobacter sp. 24YEA27 TaxID=3040672 RepID=UPI0024B3459C|nr:ABC transporter permease [Gemmobacter sp. 24YEA27]